MVNIRVRLSEELYKALGMFSGDYEELELEWRGIVAPIIGVPFGEVSVLWLTHTRANNAPDILLEIDFTAGRHGVLKQKVSGVVDQLIDELTKVMLNSRLLTRAMEAHVRPSMVYDVWPMPQHGARYDSATKMNTSKFFP